MNDEILQKALKSSSPPSEETIERLEYFIDAPLERLRTSGITDEQLASEPLSGRVTAIAIVLFASMLFVIVHGWYHWIGFAVSVFITMHMVRNIAGTANTVKALWFIVLDIGLAGTIVALLSTLYIVSAAVGWRIAASAMITSADTTLSKFLYGEVDLTTIDAIFWEVLSDVEKLLSLAARHLEFLVSVVALDAEAISYDQIDNYALLLIMMPTWFHLGLALTGMLLGKLEWLFNKPLYRFMRWWSEHPKGPAAVVAFIVMILAMLLDRVW